MRSDGPEGAGKPVNVLALWRESGEWWSFEPYREFCRYIDADGIRRESSSILASPTPELAPATPYQENNREDLDLRLGKDGRRNGAFRIRKVRDEKVTKACGYLPESPSFQGQGVGWVVGEARAEFGEGSPTPYPLPPTPSPFPHPHLASPADEREGAPGTGGAGEEFREGGLPGGGCPTPYPLPPTPSPLVLLHTLTGYAFGRSTMLAEEIPMLVAQVGIHAAAIADPFSLAGAVEFARASQKAGIKPLIGASFELEDGGEIVLIARSKRGYRCLSRLITECHLAEPRLFPLCRWEAMERNATDLICLTGGHRGPLNLALAARDYGRAEQCLERLTGLYGKDHVFVEIERCFVPWEMSVNNALLELAEKAGLQPVAGGPVTHARPEHFPAQDVLVCIETLCTVDEIVGRKPQRHPDQPPVADVPERALNGERYLRSRDEMLTLFIDRPDLLHNTCTVAARCDDDVLPPRTQLPRLFENDPQVLRDAVFSGAHLYHGKITPRLKRRLDYELERIVRLDFAGHFLIAWDVCRWAKEQEILLSGRGSVVDSAVAYCLGISRIDGFSHNLHFDRFLPNDGSKRPDIDIDFEAKRRDDVRNYMAQKYGDERVATVAAFGAYCSRGIVRGVGKVFGIPDETLGYLSKRIHGGVAPDQLEVALEKRPELRNSNIPKERFQWVFRLVKQLMDIPTNARAHSSGVVVSSEPIADTVPVMQSGADGVKIIQWDKRSAKSFFDKFDILCLRGQDVLSGTQRFAREHTPDFNAEKVPIDDPETFRAMRSGQLIGIPQSASPAMRQAHVRLRTENLHDASLVQAGIRPGVGGAVKLNELIMRRRGLQAYSFEHPLMEEILGLTYGIIVFQEQVDQLLQAFCGYTSGEAEDIRDAIHKKRREDYAKKIRDEVVGRVVERGFGYSIAEKVYDYVAGFQGYGFAQGHALAFAEISIRSIWCQQNMPAEYFASLLNAQPAGYYGPCTLANEARTRGVAILPPDVNFSEVGFSVEDVQSKMDPRIVLPRAGIRVGLMQIAELSKDTRERIVSERRFGLYDSLFDFAARVRPALNELEILILCGAFDRVNDNRRQLLWAVPQAVDWLAGSELTGSAGASPAEALESPLARHGEFSLQGRWREHTSAGGTPAFPANQLPDEQRGHTGADGTSALPANTANPPINPCLPLAIPEPELLEGIVDFHPHEKALSERRILGMDVERHLVAFERERVAAKGGQTAAEVVTRPHGTRAFVVGNPLRLRFPPTRTGKRVVFFDLEDESGLLNVTCFDAVYQRYGHAIICNPYVTVVGEVQDRDGHMAFLGHHIFPFKPSLMVRSTAPGETPIKTADFLVG